MTLQAFVLQADRPNIAKAIILDRTELFSAPTQCGRSFAFKLVRGLVIHILGGVDAQPPNLHIPTPRHFLENVFERLRGKCEESAFAVIPISKKNLGASPAKLHVSSHGAIAHAPKPQPCWSEGYRSLYLLFPRSVARRLPELPSGIRTRLR